MAYTVENYCGLIMRSKLLTPEVVQSLCRQWRQCATDPGDTKGFARWLVENQHLTEYQAALLLHGHADNFFLGPYKILERIGKGRMAGVYRAVHVQTGQVVALKVLPPSLAKDSTLLSRFLREADIARELVHPNIVRTFHAGQHHGLYFLVMEYLDGATLEEVLEQRRTLTPVETARIGFFVCQALQYLHEKRIVHRDVKPGNIMLLPAPQSQELTLRSAVKLLDVGLAREIFAPNRQLQHADLTTESTIVGSLNYLAPEQARDARRVDIRADLYSLGCVLYHCLAGQPPFVDTNPVRQLARHVNENPRPLPEINPQVSTAFWNIIARLLAKTPEERFNTPSEVVAALQAVLQETPSAPSGETSGQLQAYLSWLQEGQRPSTSPVVPAPASAPARIKPPPSLKNLRRRRKVHALVRRSSSSKSRSLGNDNLSPAVSQQNQPQAGTSPPQAPAISQQPADPPAPKPNLSSPANVPPSGPAATALSAVASSPSPNVPAPPVFLSSGSSLVSVINVEPVSAAELLKTPFGLPIPRDLFMFLLGVLSVLFLVALIWLVVWLAGGSSPSQESSAVDLYNSFLATHLHLAPDSSIA